jgi:hypothetical protein
VLAAVALVAVQGCTSMPQRTPLPTELTESAVIPGVPEARFWGDEWPRFSLQRFNTFTEGDFRANFPGIYAKPHNYLAISGGGADGAAGRRLARDPSSPW